MIVFLFFCLNTFDPDKRSLPLSLSFSKLEIFCLLFKSYFLGAGKHHVNSVGQLQ